MCVGVGECGDRPHERTCACGYAEEGSDDGELLVRASAVLRARGQKTGPVGDPAMRRKGGCACREHLANIAAAEDARSKRAHF